MVTIVFDGGTDAISGVDSGSGALERRTSALAAGACALFVGGWSPVTSPDSVPSNTCVRYRYRVADRVGNEAIYTLPTSTVMVDIVPPQTTIDVAPDHPSGDASRPSSSPRTRPARPSSAASTAVVGARVREPEELRGPH